MKTSNIVIFGILIAIVQAGFTGRYDNYSLENFFQVVASTGGWDYSAVANNVNILRNNMFYTVPSLRAITDGQWGLMGIPFAVANVAKQLAWTPMCPVNTCKHGGTPAADCSSCSGCLGGWTGTFCDVWSPSKSKDQMLAELSGIGAQSLSHQQQLQQYHPIPNQIGIGVDITTGQLRLPVVQLTYDPNDNAHTYTDYRGNQFRLPQEAVFDPLPTGKDNPTDKYIVLETVKDYISTVFSWQNSQTGMCGFFSKQTSGVPGVFSAFYQGDLSLGVAQRMYPAYKFKLPPDPYTHTRQYALDDYAQAAIDYLPPTYSDDTSKSLWKLFVQNWGTGYTVESTNGGMVEMVTGIGTDLFSISINGQYLSPADVSHQLNIDFMKKLDLSNGNGLYNEYLNRRTVSALGCSGGDPMKCDVTHLVPGYTDTINFSPVPLTYIVADIGELITDPGKKSAFQQAMQDFIHETITALNNMDTCPTCVYGACSKPATRCTCNNPRVIGVRCNMCVDGWAGVNCNTPTCGTGCVHGTCVSPNVCQCQPHYAGAHCEVCDPSWTGSNCGTPVCNPACAHGSCSAPNTCKCQTNWAGPACSVCAAGWSGSSCSVGQRCYRCGGSGQVCHPSGCVFGYVTCPACSGSTQIPNNVPRCYRCGGGGQVCHPSGCTFGYVTCPACYGKGYDPAGAVRCPKCGGGGQVCHPSGCTFGYVTCSTCGGKGYIL